MQGSHEPMTMKRFFRVACFFSTSNGPADRFISHLHFLTHFSPTLVQNMIKAPPENFRLQDSKLACACVGLVCLSKHSWAEGDTAQLVYLQHLVSYSIREPWVVTVGDDCATFGCQVPETALKAKQVDRCLRDWCHVADFCPCKYLPPKSREAEQVETSYCVCWCFLLGLFVFGSEASWGGHLSSCDSCVVSKMFQLHGMEAEPDRLAVLLNPCKECKGLIKHHQSGQNDDDTEYCIKFYYKKDSNAGLVLSLERATSPVLQQSCIKLPVFSHLATAKWPRDAGRKYPWNCWRVLPNERLWQRVTLMKISKEDSESTGFGRMIWQSAQNEVIWYIDLTDGDRMHHGEEKYVSPKNEHSTVPHGRRGWKTRYNHFRFTTYIFTKDRMA